MKTISIPFSSTTSITDKINLNSIVDKIVDAKDVVVLVGAGISTSAGIPDFRSSTGLYSSSPSPSLKSLFSSSVLTSPTLLSAHFQTLSSLHSQLLTTAPTPTHKFLSVLRKRGKLLRCYTQNIDGLEIKAGLEGQDLSGKKNEKGKGTVVQLHGSLQQVRCTKCPWTGEWTSSHTLSFAQGWSEDCPGCLEIAYLRHLSLKRSIPTKSYLRPSITLYSEPPSPHSLTTSTSISLLANRDLKAAPQVILVMGTSLKIPGFKNLVKDFAKARERGIVVFVNKERAGKEWENVFDYQIITECDTFSNYVTEQWKASRSTSWNSTQTSLSAFSSTKLSVNPTKPRRPPLSPLKSAANIPSTPPSREIGKEKEKKKKKRKVEWVPEVVVLEKRRRVGA